MYVKLNFVGDVFFCQKNCTQRFHEFFSGNQAVKLTAASRDSSRRLLLWVEAAARARARSLSSVVGTVLSKSWGGFFDGARARITEKSFLAGWLAVCCCELRGRARAFGAVARTRLVRESSPPKLPFAVNYGMNLLISSKYYQIFSCSKSLKVMSLLLNFPLKWLFLQILTLKLFLWS